MAWQARAGLPDDEGKEPMRRLRVTVELWDAPTGVWEVAFREIGRME